MPLYKQILDEIRHRYGNFRGSTKYINFLIFFISSNTNVFRDFGCTLAYLLI